MAKYDKLSDEIVDAIRQLVEGHTNAEVAEIMNGMFERKFTAKQIGSAVKNHKIKRSVIVLPKRYSEKYPEEIAKFIINNHKGTGYIEMRKMLFDNFGREYTNGDIKAFYSNHNLDSGLDGHFKPGIYTGYGFKKGYHNSPATEYKKGHIPKNHAEVGTIVRTTDGYWKIKIAEPNKWKPMQRYIWETHYGPVSNDSLIIFLDGNPDNLNLSNLAKITRSEHGRMNSMKRRSNAPEVTKFGIISVRLDEKLNELRGK